MRNRFAGLTALTDRLNAVKPIGGVQPPVAVDLGVSALKVLQLTTGEPPSLVAAASLATPGDLIDQPAKRLRFQLEALPGLVRSGKFKSQRAVCAMPAGQMLCKHLKLHLPEGADESQLVASAVAGQMGCDPGALLCRHAMVGERQASGKSEVICFAASRDLVGKLMQAMRSAKLEPVGIHSELHAMLRAFTSPAIGPQGEAPTLYLDIGRATTKVVIATGERMLFARAISFGGLELDSVVAKQMRCSLDRARQHRTQMDRLDGGGLSESAPSGGGVVLSAPKPKIDLSEPIEILTDEVLMCLRYYRSLHADKPVERAVFVGGESSHEALCAEIARVLKLPAQAADPLARVGRSGNEPAEGVDLSSAQPGWAVAMGLCLSPTDL
ncbi:MAG: pilus assembly protein PilM [Planctomycetota bacterium]